MTDRIAELAARPVEVAPGKYLEPHECSALDLEAAADLCEQRAGDLKRDASGYRRLAELV